MVETRHPEVVVKLSGEDGNAFSIIARCRRAARTAKIPQDEIDAFCKEAMSGDYDHLLTTAMQWFTVE